MPDTCNSTSIRGNDEYEVGVTDPGRKVLANAMMTKLARVARQDGGRPPALRDRHGGRRPHDAGQPVGSLAPLRQGGRLLDRDHHGRQRDHDAIARPHAGDRRPGGLAALARRDGVGLCPGLDRAGAGSRNNPSRVSLGRTCGPRGRSSDEQS